MKQKFGILLKGLSDGAAARAKAKADARAATSRLGAKMPIAQIKVHMVQALHDVTGQEIDRLQYKIQSAPTVHALWMLRTDMHQTISKLHSQSEAALRINGLLPCFSQWIAPRQMSNI
jgi:hypothetical protein